MSTLLWVIPWRVLKKDLLGLRIYVSLHLMFVSPVHVLWIVLFLVIRYSDAIR